MKTKRHKKENHDLFFSFAWLVASQEETATIDFSFWGFSWTLVRNPLQGKPEFRTWASSWNTKALAIRRWARNEKPPNEKSKISTWEVDHRVMPSSAKPGQGQPEAVRFSQLKKKNFRGFSPLVLTIERPLQIYQQGQDSPKGGVQNLESNFFAYLFLLSHRFCSRRSMLEKKTSKFY